MLLSDSPSTYTHTTSAQRKGLSVKREKKKHTQSGLFLAVKFSEPHLLSTTGWIQGQTWETWGAGLPALPPPTPALSPN
jgi:hypothetical protein